MNTTQPLPIDVSQFAHLGQSKSTTPLHPCSGALAPDSRGVWLHKQCNNEARSLQRGNVTYYTSLCAPCAVEERKTRDIEIAQNFKAEQKKGRRSSRFEDE